MKKTIVALMALTGVAGASLNYGDAAFQANSELTSGVIASYDFNTHGNNLVSGGYTLNVWNGDTKTEEPGAFTIANGYANVTTNSVYSSNMGSEFNTGSFTINFDLISTTKSANWGSILSLYSNSHGAQAGWNNALSIRNEGGANTNLYLSLTDDGVAGYDGRTDNSAKIDTGINVNSNTPTSITIVSSAAAEGADYGTLTLYINGKQKGNTITDWNAKNLVGINFGGLLGGGSKAGETIIDNVTIWNTALSAEAVAAVTIPEPATATLSLLALAGLVARRRRK